MYHNIFYIKRNDLINLQFTFDNDN